MNFHGKNTIIMAEIRLLASVTKFVAKNIYSSINNMCMKTILLWKNSSTWQL